MQNPLPCPSDEELARFLTGTDEETRRLEIAGHVAACPDCKGWLGGMGAGGGSAKGKSAKVSPIVWVALIMGVLLLGLFLFLQILPQQYEKVRERIGVYVESGGLARILPIREVQPGQVFPRYRPGESVQIDAGGADHLALFWLDGAGRLRRVPPQEPIRLEGPTALHFFLLLRSSEAIPEAGLADFERKIQAISSQVKGLDLYGPLESLILSARWRGQLLTIEVGG